MKKWLFKHQEKVVFASLIVGILLILEALWIVHDLNRRLDRLIAETNSWGEYH